MELSQKGKENANKPDGIMAAIFLPLKFEFGKLWSINLLDNRNMKTKAKTATIMEKRFTFIAIFTIGR
jgi:hypothetical protein